MYSSSAELILSSCRELFKTPKTDIELIGEYIPIPFFSADTIFALCADALETLKREKSLVRINGKYVIVGDLHGNLRDLIRIIIFNGLPKDTNYLFLGDYVDRGEFSTEVFCIILTLKVLFPNNVTLIRGNHELRDVNSFYGLKKELETAYGSEEGLSLWERMNDVFDYLPLVCILNETTFCVHGGISKSIQKLSHIESLTLPISKLTKPIEDLLWSDPMEASTGFGENTRGKGCVFGYLAVSKFLKDNNLNCIIRAHQCVMNGIDIKWCKKFYTVFSSSGYSGEKNNGAILVSNDEELNKFIYFPMPPLKRETTSIFKATPQAILNAQKLGGPGIIEMKKTQLASLKNYKKPLSGKRTPSGRMNPVKGLCAIKIRKAVE